MIMNMKMESDTVFCMICIATRGINNAFLFMQNINLR